MKKPGWWDSARNTVAVLVVAAVCFVGVRDGAVGELTDLAKIIVTALFITKAVNGRPASNGR